jgi:cytoskeletal protein CcmA (bactofilin family)
LWYSLLLVVLLIGPASIAYAGESEIVQSDGGRIFVDEDVALEPGETFAGDLGVFNGDLTVPPDSTVNGSVFVADGDADVAGLIKGDLAVLGGDLELSDSGRVRGDVFTMSGSHKVAGQVNGDLSSMFGDMELGSAALVNGDLLVISGQLEREPGAQVQGDELSELRLPDVPLFREQPRGREVPDVPEVPEVPAQPEWAPRVPQSPSETLGSRVGRFLGRMVSAGFMSLLFVAAGMLIVIVWPKHTRRVAECISAAPAQSFGLGLLTFVIAAVLEVVAVVLMVVIILVAAVLISTVLLIPVGLLLILLSGLVLLPVPLILAGAVILGWVSLAETVGRKVLAVVKVENVRPLGAVLVGLLLTVSLAATLWVIEPLCCAWPFIILLTSIGVGGVIHSRFGRQPCWGADISVSEDVLPLEAMDEELGQPDRPNNLP